MPSPCEHSPKTQGQASTQHSTVGAGTSRTVLSGHPNGDSNDQAAAPGTRTYPHLPAAPGTRIYPHPPTFAHPILHPSSHSQGSSQQTPPSASAFDSRTATRIFSLLEEICAEGRENARKLDMLLLGIHTQRNIPQAEVPPDFNFPLGTPEELEELERLLSTNEEQRRRLVRHLGTIGGRDQRHTVENILRAVVGVRLARQYNYCGLKGKKCFSGHTAVFRTIQEGVRVMHGATTNEEIRLFAATWFSGSRDREGGKKERQHARQLDNRE